MFAVTTNRQFTERIPLAWVKGTGAKLINPIPNNKPMLRDEYFFFGILRGSGEMFKRCIEHKCIFYYADHAYLYNDENQSIKEQIMKIHKRWRNVEYWQAIKRTAPPYTMAKYLKGIDMYIDADGGIAQVDEDRRIHRILWLRTLEIALFVTIFCFLMGYPIAHLLATLPMKYSNLLMICVLLPFWTSLLVRTASWMILLQQQGLVNDFFVLIGLVADNNRPEMMYNKVGTYVAMTQILLPFMVLPLYSVMKTISPSLMRAGKSLGGTPFVAFWKVYFPLTIPGIGAGCLLVFILAIGYYITPALVGGASGTLISNQIAYHMKTTLDWSFASAMGLMLLSGVLVIYWIYNKLVGVDNIKLG